MKPPPPSIRLVEVSPRDGLQNIPSIIPTQTKLDLIRRLSTTGLNTVEITSIVSPRAIPQLSDCREVLDHEIIQNFHRIPVMRLPVLVPNLKGLEIALQHGVREVAVFISASEGFSRANINCSVEEGIGRAKMVAERAREAGVAVRGYISCIFTDPITQTPTPPASVLSCTKLLLAAGVYEVSLGDTTGMGTPESVRDLLTYLSDYSIPVSKLAGHFHDSHGRGIDNVWEAYCCGVRVFDSSVAGLGGCPFAPGARGNVATEEVVRFFESMGVETGVDVRALGEVARWVQDVISQRVKPPASASKPSPQLSHRITGVTWGTQTGFGLVRPVGYER
ncbi:hypothetical protein BJX61DRAFT_534214 [Aspergillus egyptiacus]|nr:hypothetical protein BJX61DRAFT_534214 [Aspergillus egyptiacus]